MKKNEFLPASPKISVSTGETIRMLRDLMGWTQEELAKKSGINAKNISMLENDKIEIGKKRAESLAHAFGIHPSIIMFPEYEAEYMQKVA